MEERIALTTGDGLVLDARLAALPGTRAAVVIAPPHPLYGGRMDNPVVEAVAEGCARAGLATLRFDYRGCGDSEGRASGDAADADADYAAALAALEQRGHARCFAAGYSFGAATAIRAAASRPALQRVIVVAPPVGMLDRDLLARVRAPIAIAVGDADVFAPLARLEALVGGLATVTLTVLEGADHFFAMESEDLAAFAERAAATSASSRSATSRTP